MKIDWSKDANAPHGLVIDLDTGKPITGPEGYCFFVDEETGEWKRHKRVNGLMVCDGDGMPIVECGRSNVRFFASGTPEFAEAIARQAVAQR